MDPVKDTLLPDQTQIVRNNTIPPLVYFTNSHFLYLEYSFPQLGPLKFMIPRELFKLMPLLITKFPKFLSSNCTSFDALKTRQ